MKSLELTLYRDLLGEIKTRVRQAQCRAALSANAEMILMDGLRESQLCVSASLRETLMPKKSAESSRP